MHEGPLAVRVSCDATDGDENSLLDEEDEKRLGRKVVLQ
jgi:hypothetical protein